MGYFFAEYLVNINVYRGIIEYFAQYGANVGGIDLNVKGKGGALFSGISPSKILSYYSCAMDNAQGVVEPTGTVSYITIKIVMAISEVIFFITMLVIAYLVVEIFIKTYLLLYVGFILTGFAGSSWTMSFWQRYLQQIVATAIEFMVMCVLLGVVNNMTIKWELLITGPNKDIYTIASVFYSILGVALMLSFLMYSLPSWAGAKLSGEVRLRLDDKMTAMSGVMSGGRR